MPASRKVPWLVAYDITAPDRLQRVHRAMRQAAEPLQYSLFHRVATRRDMVHLMTKLDGLIDARSDDVRAYPLLTAGSHTVYGRPSLPEGVLLLGSNLLIHNLHSGGAASDMDLSGQLCNLPKNAQPGPQPLELKGKFM